MEGADVIGAVERCYDLKVDDRQWHRMLAESVNGLLRPELGVVAYELQWSGRDYRFRNAAQAGANADLVGMIGKLDRLAKDASERIGGLFGYAQARLLRRMLESNLAQPDTNFLEHERTGLRAPRWMYDLGVAGLQDRFVFVNRHTEGGGATVLVGGFRRRRELRASERTVYQMLSAHIQAGRRLRLQLREGPAPEVPAGGAVLDMEGRVLEADGSAKRRIGELKRAADTVLSARGPELGRGPAALRVWQGLLEGRWSIAERTEGDGKRYLLAHRNLPAVRDPRGLTASETRVLALALRGYSDALIGYHLGLEQSAAATHLAAAMGKLGIRSRAALVGELGSRYSGAPEPSREDD